MLHTGKDFIIIDFEGPTTRPLGVRRLKQPAFRDVADMLRSFHAAADEVLFGPAATSRPEDRPALEPWARFWYAWVSAAFLRAWMAVVGPTALVPRDREPRQILLDAYLLEASLAELGRALRQGPERARNPLRAILATLQAE